MKIVLTTDFTPAADNAIDYTLHLFKEEKEVEYILFLAYKSMIPYSQTPPAIPVPNNDALEEKLNAKLREVNEQLVASVKINSVLKTGTLGATLATLIEEEDPDLIVMGSREKSTMERMTLGSNVLEAAHKIQCPILTIPLEAKYDGLEKIVFASDLEPLEVDYTSINILKSLASKARKKMEVLHIFGKGKSDKDSLKEKIEDTPLHRYLWDVEHIHTPQINNSTEDGLTNYIQETEPDLMTLIPRKRNFLEKIFHNSLTERMVYHTKIPMLLML